MATKYFDFKEMTQLFENGVDFKLLVKHDNDVKTAVLLDVMQNEIYVEFEDGTDALLMERDILGESA